MHSAHTQSAHHETLAADVGALAPADVTDSAGDAELVARVRAGDAGAFESLFHAHHAGVRAFVLGTVGSAAVADEVVQEVFLALWVHRAQWNPPGSSRTYIYRAARNAALNVVRAGRMVRRWEAQVDQGNVPSGMSEGPGAADEMLEHAEQAAAIERAVQTLPPRCREVFLLKWRDNLKYTEIAEVTGLAVKTVENQLMRALRLLRDRLPPPPR